MPRLLFLVIMQKNGLLMQHLLFPTSRSDLTRIRTTIALNIIENHAYQDKGLHGKGIATEVSGGDLEAHSQPAPRTSCNLDTCQDVRLVQSCRAPTGD